MKTKAFLLFLPLLTVAAVSAGLLGSTAYAQSQTALTVTSPVSNDVIYSNTVTVTGTSIPGYSIAVTDLALSLLNSTLVTSAAGDWSVDISLSDGTHTILVAAFPVPENLTEFISSDPIVIDVSGGDPGTGALPGIEITSPIPGTIVKGSTVELQGTAMPDHDISIVDLTRAAVAGTTSKSDGSWSVEIQEVDGMHTFVAALLGDGGIPLSADSVTIFVEGSEPPGPTYPTVTSPASGAVIPGNTFTVTGTAPAGAAITLSDIFAVTVATTTADEAGTWSAQVTHPDGIHVFYAISKVGDSLPLHSIPFLVYLSLDEEPGPGELPLPEITSPAYGALITDGSNVLISGTAVPDAVVTVFGLDIMYIGTDIADGSGDWSLTAQLADGLHTLTARYIVDDQESGHSQQSIIHVDSDVTLDERPAVTHPFTASVHDSGDITINGTAIPNAMITIINHEAPIDHAMSDDTGMWSITRELPSGLYIISAVASRGDGTESGNSEAVFFFVNEPADAPRPMICR